MQQPQGCIRFAPLRVDPRGLAAHVDVDPRFEARGELSFDAHVSRDFVCIGMRKFGVRDL
jgi:hypothetical protein